MPATLTLQSMTAQIVQHQISSSDREYASQGNAPVVSSSDLLKGGKSIGIEHKGAFYRLQETKLGKLILTK